MELNEEVQSLNKFDLEPLESYLMFGKGHWARWSNKSICKVH